MTPQPISMQQQSLEPPTVEHDRIRRVARTPAVNPGPGSYRLLAMLARLGVAGVEPLACTLKLSLGATYSHTRRLAKAGLVWRVPLGDGGGEAVAISRTFVRPSIRDQSAKSSSSRRRYCRRGLRRT